MAEDLNFKSLFRKMLPRIVKAAIKSIFWFVLLYVVPMSIISSLSALAPEIFTSYGQLLNMFVAIMIFFVIASELTAGTIFQHALNIGKALILMMFIVIALQGGIVTIDLPGMPMLANLNVVADLRIYLIILLIIDFLGLAKSVLQAINFLSERTEKQFPTPSPSQ